MTYKIVREIGTQKTGKITRQSHLVELDTPTVCRASKTFDLYEISHVVVEALRIFEDDVAYEETHVVASDAQGNLHDAILYQATKALTVPEAMFSIGEHNFADLLTDDTQDGETDAS